MPRASPTQAIVFAVYMPAHEPVVGHAARSSAEQLLVAHRALRVAADGLEHVLDRDVAPL